MEEKAEKTRLVAIDSSVFVDHLRSYFPAVELFRIISSSPSSYIFSTITETELIAGKSCNDLAVRTIVLNMLNSLAKIEVNNAIALRAGDISRIHGTDLPDSIIAATALINKAVLLTKNVKDFEKIKELKIRVPY